MANGTSVRGSEEMVINTYGSKKVSAKFIEPFNIDHHKKGARVWVDMAKNPLDPDESKRPSQTEIDDVNGILAKEKPPVTPADPDYVKKFRAARLKKTVETILGQEGLTRDTHPGGKRGYDDDVARRLQSMADSVKGLDKVTDDRSSYPSLDERAPEQIDIIRDSIAALQADGAIPPPSNDNGVPYRRRSFTDQPGVVETTPDNKPVFLRQVPNRTRNADGSFSLKDPANPTARFVSEKYILDENGNPVDYVPGTSPPTS
jgi:hypothetical protein